MRKVVLGAAAVALVLTACGGASGTRTPTPAASSTQPATGPGSGNFSDPDVLAQTIMSRMEANGGTPTDVTCTPTSIILHFTCAVTDINHPYTDGTYTVTVTPDLSGYTVATP